MIDEVAIVPPVAAVVQIMKPILIIAVGITILITIARCEYSSLKMKATKFCSSYLIPTGGNS
uniref:NADH dehydrogenase subunit 1 n=1 Tax=Romanomermis culicivorax TaxID=13658 RepID=A0A915I0V6_ROMCU